MTPRFLREEAARCRGMASEADRVATKDRFLAMAVDYDARAKVASEADESKSGEANKESVEATQDEVRKPTPAPHIATGLKETILVQRRPVGRPRRE